MRNTMARRDFMRGAAGLGALAALGGAAGVNRAFGRERLPNVVIIFIDDQGYADLGAFGAKGFETPNLDGMAADGVKFTDFYVAQPVCGASRAALLTGCYPNRIGMLGAPSHNAKHGIHERETTIAEMLKPLGYATAMCGKWHLGHHKRFLPTRHGFDQYYGLPYSNDMWPFHPEATDNYPPLPLIEGEDIIEYNPDQSQLTTEYTNRAVKFIEDNKDRPFFLYVAHSMVHVPLFVSDKFKGKSEQELYGDTMMEIDWSAGEILKTLERLGLSENTLVIYTSDNGPWLSYGDHAGSALPLREGKGTTWDGGVREPALMQWKGKIPAGSVCREPAMTIDLMPTIARLTGGRLPAHPIDGMDIWPLMAGEPGAECPHEAYYFYWGRELQAVRSGKWKLHVPHAYRTLAGREGGSGGFPARYEQARTELALFNLEEDIGEERNVAAHHPDVVARLSALAERARADLGDEDRRGANTREPGRVPW